MIESLTSLPAAATATGQSATAQNPLGALGKNDFLKLLITQMRNQDPLNPLDQNQFLAQTAQFTSLETLQNIASELEALREAASGSSLSQAAPLLGRTVKVAAREFTFDGTVPAELGFTVDAPAGQVRVEIVDPRGGAIRQLVTEPVEAGAHTVAWDGLDSQGRALQPGTYVYRVSASGGTGTPPVAAAAEGTLTGLSLRDGGVVFRMGDILVRQDDIIEVL